MQILVPPSLLKMMPSPWHLGTSTIISSSSESCGSYRVKGIPDGSVERYKARLVAHQRPGRESFDRLSPVGHLTEKSHVSTSRSILFFSLQVSKSYGLKQAPPVQTSLILLGTGVEGAGNVGDPTSESFYLEVRDRRFYWDSRKSSFCSSLWFGVRGSIGRSDRSLNYSLPHNRALRVFVLKTVPSSHLSSEKDLVSSLPLLLVETLPGKPKPSLFQADINPGIVHTLSVHSDSIANRAFFASDSIPENNSIGESRNSPHSFAYSCKDPAFLHLSYRITIDKSRVCTNERLKYACKILRIAAFFSTM
ncbi:unnamed protein product [Arabidopsis thaliana]|uniref:(thale cress) hypothetical protein n=1 Tax=Arabidopsis thaliana TaxID=3702 RepID=A0A7G2E7Y5_ARATH|nr:unnamed protein product [Arabidopsis thaliana]CAD5318313.1 unnamed protein product [Arabidopsis thaliana]